MIIFSRVSDPRSTDRTPAASILFSLVLIFAFCCTSAGVSAFSDVEEDHWARHSIDILTAGGAIDGYPDGRFHPGQTVTRAEFTKIIVTALDRAEEAENLRDFPLAFSDVDPDHWAKASIAAARELGLIQGVGDGRFAPDKPITRAEMVVILSRAAGDHGDERPADELPFSDLEVIPLWARSATALAFDRGLIAGYPDGTFRPMEATSRVEAVTMIHRHLARRNLIYDQHGLLVEADAAADQLNVLIDSGLVSVTIGPQIPLYRNGRSVSIHELQPLDQLVLIGRASAPRYVEAFYAEELGIILEKEETKRRLHLLTDARQEPVIRRVRPDAAIFHGEERLSFAELAEGDLVTLVHDAVNGGARLVIAE